jgi:hypothetical protein
MKNTKVIYKTDAGKTFKTIASVSEMIAFDYMTANYGDIEIISMKPSAKKGYKNFCNVKA